MTKKELVANLTELGVIITATQMNKMTKAELEMMLADAQDIREFEHSEEYVPTTDAEAEEANNAVIEANDVVLRKFDLKKYMGYECPANQRDLGITSGQYNLIHSLEANFKCSIDMSKCSTRGQASDKISRVFDAIAKGIVKARPEAEITKNLESYKHVKDNSATKAQLSYITRLEKELNATDSKVITDKKAASERIAELLSRKNAKPVAHEEVAVTEHEPMPVVSDMLKKPGFKQLFANILRRVAYVID